MLKHTGALTVLFSALAIGTSSAQQCLHGSNETPDQDGYWFMIADLADPCGFAYISNQAGVIFSSEPIR